MIKAILQKEIKQYQRDDRVIAMLLIILVLGLGSAFYGWNTVTTLEKERNHAFEMDKDTWQNQGKKNAHTAAHFSRYVFQPTSNLAIFDPGLQNVVGQAIWVEAHFQDPPKFRPIEDNPEIQRFAQLSPAWLLQYFAPLLIILLSFASIAGERQSGTLRQVMSSGISPQAVFWGKGLATLVIVSLLAPVILLPMGFSIFSEHLVLLPDTAMRLSLMVLMYFLYLVTFILLSISVSAIVTRAKSALLILIAIWGLGVTLAPRIAADAAATLSPLPQSSAFADQLSAEAGDAFWSDEPEAVALRNKIRDDLLAEYQVDKVDDLPINYDGYLLQASEEYANAVFDQHYDELWNKIGRQQDYARVMALISPTIAMQNISRSLAGTDWFAHRHFSAEAEQYRREFVRLLNEEMTEHGGKEGYAYLSDNDFWQSNPDFDYAPPRFDEVVEQIRFDLLILFMWFGITTVLAMKAVKVAFVKEALK